MEGRACWDLVVRTADLDEDLPDDDEASLVDDEDLQVQVNILASGLGDVAFHQEQN